jgi:PAS domain S-box-containing protein
VARTLAVVQTAQDSIITFSRHDLAIISLNPTAETLFGHGEAQLAGQPVTLLLEGHQPATDGQGFALLNPFFAAATANGGTHETIGRRMDGSTFPMEMVITEAQSGQDGFYVGTFRNLTERRRIEQERVLELDALIHAQAATLIGEIDTQRAQRVLEVLLRGVEASRARVVIVDITGMGMVDAQVAMILVRAGQAVGLLGAELVVTGIRPEVAQTLETF